MIRYGPDFAPRGLRAATDYLVVHCSAGHPAATADAIVRFHMEVRGWRSCGYHAVIEQDGTLVETLHPDAIGAHIGDVKPVGSRAAYGVCLIGGVALPSMRPVDNFTQPQMHGLADQLLAMSERYPNAKVAGHRDLIRRYGAPPKACPCFDVEPWWHAIVEAAATADKDAAEDVGDGPGGSAASIAFTWLIEHGTSDASAPTYWCGRHGWQPDREKAVRFAREVDARSQAAAFAPSETYRVAAHGRG